MRWLVAIAIVMKHGSVVVPNISCLTLSWPQVSVLLLTFQNDLISERIRVVARSKGLHHRASHKMHTQVFFR